MWLAIDTSGDDASLAWIDPADGAAAKPVWQQRVRAGRSHNTRIFAPLAEAMRHPAAGRLTGLVVGTGPGSYTGIRIGIACALGISLQRDGVPIFPWPSCTAMQPLDPGRRAGAADYLLLGDARRGRFSLCEVRAGRLSGSPRLLEREALVDGWLQDPAAPPLWSNDPDPGALEARLGLVAGAVEPVGADAGRLAARVAGLPDDERAALAAAPPSPIYLAAPFVTRPKS